MSKTDAKKKILIAEDEKAMATALKLKLEKSGFTAVVANNGEDILAKMKKEKFDLLLLDIVMSKKDGFEVLEDLKTHGDKTPVIVASNLSQKEDIKRAKDLGAIDYFVKSDTPIVEVVEHVRRTLHV